MLGPYDIKPKRELGGEYKDQEYIVQYGETDYDFCCRLLEQAGITYYYRFGAKPEIVLSDAPQEGPERPGPPLHYVDEPHAEARQDYVTKVALAHRVRPGKATLRDYDFRKKPDFPLQESEDGGRPEEKGYEQYFYVPGAMLVEKGGTGSAVADDRGIARHLQSEGRARVERWLGSLRRGARSVSFATNALDLAPGLLFRMARHPHAELGESAKLLVTELNLDGTPVGDWTMTGRACFAADGYQPALRSEKSRIAGVQSAVVVGPKGEEIYTDEYGRARVQFHWDREGKGISQGEASTKWLRPSQPWAGRRFGAIAVPRIGHEVLVRYFEGDPEQPAVVGRAYNKLRPVPYPLPKHKVKAVWKSDTSPHAEGSYNEIRFDDRHELEHIYTQAQRDRQELVRRHKFERTGINRVTVVGENRSAIVAAVDATMVGKTYSLQITKKPKVKELKILDQKMPELEPKDTKVAMAERKLMATTSSATVEMDDDEVIFAAKGEISVKAGGMVIIQGGPKVKINC
ncbi:MAG: type VI secretion system tip protein VgrG [Deltaproteobacteria bacterium]|nr:type VI secretion system tip protein VgrG [Deltaproteobacteria bacterium]